MDSVVVEPPKRRGRKRKRNYVPNASMECDSKTKVLGIRSLKLVGQYVRKEFQGNGVYLGKIMSYDSGLYRINYEDGDCEDLDSGEVKVFLIECDDLNGEWFERKEKLDKLLLSKDVNANLSKVENSVEPPNVKHVDLSSLSQISNGDDGATKAAEVCDDADVYSDSSSVSCEDARERDSSLDEEVPLIPPPELPPSSGHIGVSEEYVSHLFSIYSFLRSFSVPLYLCPFGFDEFVGALNCSVANTLLDSVHVALMRMLKRHFEKLSSEGSELAIKCLRCLDWSLLDELTWPVYLVHYLMLTGYTNGPDWNEIYVNLVESDYYTLSSGKKLKVLQLLCDDCLDSEELRAEMDSREESEVGIDLDTSSTPSSTRGPRRVHPRYSKTSALKNKEAVNGMAEHHDIPPIDDEDGNGDECRLCGMDGFLLCCDGCPSSYHSRCLGIHKLSMPAGLWYCPECKINATEPKISRGTELRGGNICGVDLYEQVFLATCDHLLVLKASIDSGNCIRYYNRRDIPGVIHTLSLKTEHVIMYSEICREIVRCLKLPEVILPRNELSETCPIPIPSENSFELITKSNQSGDRDCTGQEFDIIKNTIMTKPTFDLGQRSTYMGSPFKTTSYINCYMHGDFAASAAANLAVVTSEESHVNESLSSDKRRKIMSASVSLQLKAFSSAAIRFFWPNTEKKLVEVPRERCSWCFNCKAPGSSKRGCLLNAAASNAIRGGPIKVPAGVRPMKNGDGRLPGIATYVLFMEESLRGLQIGPFLNDTFRRRWRKLVEQANTCNAVKILLLELEENIRSIAFSEDWLKFADDFSSQSCTSQITASAAGSTQKRKKRGRRPAAAAVEAAVDDSQEKDFTWWRGGKLSKILFHKGMLPRSMAKRTARQGGSKKIQGIHYVEGNETLKRSRQLIWRAAVEMSRNTAQLAHQVRCLDFHVRWSDLVRPEQVASDAKGPETEASAFRNAFVCHKKILGREIQYCVDFGSQKHLPSRVMKNIIETEQMTDDGKERYWFFETRIPLYLIKEYEEKVETFKPVDVLTKLQRCQLMGSRKNVFSYLVRKRDNMERSYCCSCHLDVLSRNAVTCSACQGLCHEKCATSSIVNSIDGVKYRITCKQCYETRPVIRLQTNNKSSPDSPLLVKGRDFPNLDKSGEKLVVSYKGSSSVSVGTTQAQPSLNNKSANRSTAAKKSSKIKHWGLIWKKSNCENTGIDFRLKNILMKGNPDRELNSPTCRLCNHAYNADLMYIRCEACQYWFHADAVELDESKIFDLVGFKCCKCRRIRSPVCPYLDPTKKKVLEDKIEQKLAAPKQDTHIYENHNEPTKEESIYAASEDSPLVSLSEIEQFIEEEKSESYYGFNDASFSAPQKLPVRRTEEKLELDYGFNDASLTVPQKLPVRRQVKQENNNSTNSVQVEAFDPMEIQWDVSKESFDDSITLDYESFDFDDVEFEPQTYFSFNELLSSENGGGNGSSLQNVAGNGTLEIPYNEEEELTLPVQTSTYIAQCKICSFTEPGPDLCCQTCGLWIHSHCSPWVESSSRGEGWCCGNCREWR